MPDLFGSLGPAPIYWIGFIAVSAAISALPLFSKDFKDTRRATLMAIIALAALGSSAGMIGGLSRIGVAGQIVAAALSLIGGGAIVLFSLKENTATARAAIVITAFVSALFLGFIGGAHLRAPSDMIAFWMEKCIDITLDYNLAEDSFILLNYGEICGNIVGASQRQLGLR